MQDYVQQYWEDEPSTVSPIQAARLNHIELGIKAVTTDLIALKAGAPIDLDTLLEVSNKLAASDAALSGILSSLADRYTKAQSDARYAQPRERLFHTMAGTGANSYPATSVSGHTLTWSGTSSTISGTAQVNGRGGFYAAPAAAPTAAYMTATMAKKPMWGRIRFIFLPGTTPNGTACIAVTSTSTPTGSPTMSVHFRTTRTGWAFSIWNSGEVVLASGSYDNQLFADPARPVEYEMAFMIIGSSAFFKTADGVVRTVTDARIASLGGNYMFGESYAPQMTDDLVAITQVEGGEAAPEGLLTGSSITQLDLQTLLSLRARSVNGVTPDTAGNVSLTKTNLGLGNVDNTSDASKPVSTAVTAALSGKEPTITAGTTSQYFRGDKTWATHDKASIGLGNVDNTSDANKPVSSAVSAALANKASITHTHTVSDISATGTPGSSTFLRGDGVWASPPAGGGGTSGVTTVAGRTGDVTLTKSDVGLANVDNTADSAKPVSALQQTALNAKADVIRGLVSNTMIGTIAPEDNQFVHLPHLFNDLHYNRQRGGSMTLTKNGTDLGVADQPFAPDVTFTGAAVTSTDTLVATVNCCRTFSYGTIWGVAFPSLGWVPASVQIEVWNDTNAAWATKLNVTGNTSQVLTCKTGDATTSSKMRITMSGGAPANSIRISSIFALSYASELLTSGFLPKGGGTVYGQAAIGPGAQLHATASLQVGGSSTTAAGGGLALGPDTILYRIGAAAIKTDGELVIGGRIQMLGSLVQSFGFDSAATVGLTTASPAIRMANATSNAISYTLPTITASGYRIIIKKTDSSSNTVTISATSIEGATTYVLSKQYDYVELASTTTSGSWLILDANVRDGSVSVAKLSATGTKDGTKFLRDDNTWAAPVIVDGSVVTSKIADANVTTAKYADGSVTIPKISATGTPSTSTYLRGDGSWSPVASGGTGSDSRFGVYATNVGGGAGPYTITHGLGTRDVFVVVHRINTTDRTPLPVNYKIKPDGNTVVLEPDTAWAANEVRCEVFGVYGLADITPPSKATLTSSAKTDTTITAQGAATDNVAVYAINYYRGGVYQSSVAPGTAYVYTGLTASTTYSLTASATDTSGNEGPLSDALSVTTDAPPPDTTAPTKPTLTLVSKTQTTVNASASSTDNVGITAWRWYRNGSLISGATTSTLNDTGLTAASSYSYTAQALDAAGNVSSTSDALAVTTDAAAITYIGGTTAGANASPNATTPSYTMGSGTNRIAVVAVSLGHTAWQPESGFTTTTVVSSNGDTYTKLGVANNAPSGQETGQTWLFYKLNPTAGAQTITASVGKSGMANGRTNVILAEYANVSAINNFAGTQYSNTATAAVPASLTVTTAAGNVAIAAFGFIDFAATSNDNTRNSTGAAGDAWPDYLTLADKTATTTSTAMVSANGTQAHTTVGAQLVKA